MHVQSLRRLVPLLLPVVESAVTSPDGDSKVGMEVALWSPITLSLCRRTNRMGPALEVQGGGGGSRETLQQQKWERHWKTSLLFCLTRLGETKNNCVWCRNLPWMYFGNPVVFLPRAE